MPLSPLLAPRTRSYIAPVREPVTLSVIVPVYEERVTTRKLLERLHAVPIRKEIIIVDDGSADGTADVIRQFAATHPDTDTNRVRTFFHERNRGKGAALRTGIAQVTGDITIFQDADLEYSPEEYPQLIAPIVSGEAEVVYGSRFLGTPRRVLLFRHTLGNRLLTFLSNLCTDLNLTDMETCYKAFRTDVLRRLHLVSDRFDIEPEITAKIARLGCRIYEVPISYHGREYWEGKKINWRDGFVAAWTIFKYAVVARYSYVRESTEPGFKTLDRLRHARRYNDWVWSRLSPYIGDRVLEIGCGVGNFTRFLRNRDRVVATDNNAHYLAAVRRSLDHFDNVDVRHVDWEDPNLDGLCAERFDTILCLNVLEHIQNDEAALGTFAALLQPRGRLVLQVPAMKWLHGEIDRNIGHVRRYERDELAARLRAHGFDIEELTYFNLPGLVAWYVNSVLLQRRTVPGLQARGANLLVPWLRLEQRFRLRHGMALIAVARKTGAATAAAPFRIPEMPIVH
jgi:glycosyltransferase involved in cell wall biosynthesis